MDKEHLVYLYCVTAQPPDLARVADRPDELYLVREAGLCAVVSHVEASQFEPARLRRNLENLEWVAAETTKHERIVEAVMRDRCAVPFRFGTLFRTDENLMLQLRTNGAQLKTLLEHLEDKAEWGVKAYCDTQSLENNIRSQDGPVSDLNEAIRRAAPGRAFLLKKKREDLVKAALVDGLDQYAAQMVAALQTVSVQMRMNKILPPGMTDRSGIMILNVALLVANHDVPTFLDMAHALNERYVDQSIAVECSGPWPPYNFCDQSGASAPARLRSMGVPPMDLDHAQDARATESCEDARPTKKVTNG
jgi:hypothetical protein